MNDRSENLILFLHFHKAGGTSIVRMFQDAEKVFHHPHVNGNPWIRDFKEIIEFWNFDVRELKAWAQENRFKGVEFIACEWDFLSRETRQAWTEFTLITCMRDPFDRAISDYLSMGGDQRWGDIRCWYGSAKLIWQRDTTNQKFPVTHNLPNHYVRMLNGLGTNPDTKLVDENLDYAKHCLELFDTIMILDKSESFSLLNKYGVIGPAIHANRGNKSALELPKGFRNEFIEDNRYDYELYEYGLTRCKAMLDLGEATTNDEII